MAKVRLSFDAWKDGNVSPMTVDVPTQVLEVKSSPRLRATLEAHKSGVQNLLFSPDGRALATAGAGGEVALWDVAARKQRLNLPRHGQAYGLAFTPDGKRLLVPSYEPTDAAGKTLQPPYGGSQVHGLRGGVRICDVGLGEQVGWLRRDPARGVSRVYVMADGKTAVAQEHAQEGKQRRTTTTLYDLATLKPRGEVATEQGLFGISPDGTTLACSARGKGVLWDVRSGKERASLTGDGEHLGRCVFSRDGRTLAGLVYGAGGNFLTLWDVASGKLLKRIAPGAVTVLPLALSPDGTRLAVGLGPRGQGVEACDVLIWDVKTGKQLLALRGHVDNVLALDFHPDGRLLASGGSDGTVRLWDVGP